MSTEADHHPPLQQGEVEAAEANEDFVVQDLIIDSNSSSDIDVDSGIGEEGVHSSSSSLASVVTNFRTMYGRRYHAFDDNAYWLPNDDEEINRLELQHLVWKLCLNGRLHIAPVPEDVHSVVDLGTGTGKWAMEFADAHPSAEVLGTDLSPIQSTLAPPNCTFIVENVEHDWEFSEPFDYIHSRMLCLGKPFPLQPQDDSNKSPTIRGFGSPLSIHVYVLD
jgi:Methyltransferase domain